MIAWVDIETSGLEPKDGLLLEVGIILTDDDLNETARTSMCIKPPPAYLNKMAGPVRRMHAESGLLDALDGEWPDLSEAERHFFYWISARTEEPLVLAGNTVGFDRAWLKAKMPLFERQFHYRSIDVSSLKELNRRWRFAPQWEGDRKIHRALPDLEDSIAELGHYREALR